MVKPGRTGISRIIHATGYSMLGLQSAWRVESAFRQETVLAIILTPCAFLLGETLSQTALLVATVLLVLVVELLNSAVEAVIDRIGPEHHDLAGRAKDMGSAAVFVSLTIVVLTWTLVAIERFG